METSIAVLCGIVMGWIACHLAGQWIETRRRP